MDGWMDEWIGYSGVVNVIVCKHLQSILTSDD